MKPYPSTMREKRRYIVFEVMGPKCSKKSLNKALWTAVFSGIGSFGAADSSFWLIDYDEALQKGILRAKNTKITEVKASIALLDKIDSNPAFIRFVKTTGTIKKAREIAGMSQ